MKERSAGNGWRSARGPVVLVAAVGAARGARAAAAALACAASEPDQAALLIDLDEGRPPRPSLIATAGARALEERLSAHMSGAPVASRGQMCRLSLPPDPEGIEQIAAAIPLVRESAAVIHLPPSLVRAALDEPRIPVTAVLLRADLGEARALAALAVRDLMTQGLRVAVLKHRLGWAFARAALLGVVLPGAGGSLPVRLHERLFKSEDNKLRQCYDREADAAGENDGIER